MANWDLLAEEKIRAAMREGGVEDLPHHGRPLPRRNRDGVPAELRLAYDILQNAGALPPELEARKELVRIEDLLAVCGDDAEERRLRREWNAARFRYDTLMERSRGSRTFRRYAPTIRRRLGL